MWRWINPEKQRYYLADLVQDLFGEWTLVKAWGGLEMRRGNHSITGVSSYEEGIRKIDDLDTYRKKRGYVATDWTSQITTLATREKAHAGGS